MSRTVTCLGLAIGALALAAAALGSGGAHSQSAPTRVVDRTMLCKVANFGQVHVLNVEAYSKTDPSTPAQVELLTQLQPGPRLALLHEETVELKPGCRRSSARVPLTPKGLRGGIASPLGDTFACVTPPVVLIRVRAVFNEPVTLESGRPYGSELLLFARGTVNKGSLAVRTRKGKQLAYGAVSAGKARLLTRTRDCIPK